MPRYNVWLAASTSVCVAVTARSPQAAANKIAKGDYESTGEVMDPYINTQYIEMVEAEGKEFKVKGRKFRGSL